MNLTLIWVLMTLLLLLVDLWAMASVWRTSKSPSAKAGWYLIILALPVIGLVIWGIMGPRGIAEPPSSDEHSKG